MPRGRKKATDSTPTTTRRTESTAQAGDTAKAGGRTADSTADVKGDAQVSVKGGDQVAAVDRSNRLPSDPLSMGINPVANRAAATGDADLNRDDMPAAVDPLLDELAKKQQGEEEEEKDPEFMGPGAEGDNVRSWQRNLNEMGFLGGVSFDEKTVKATKDFQKVSGLKQTGKADRETRMMMRQALMATRGLRPNQPPE